MPTYLSVCDEELVSTWLAGMGWDGVRRKNARNVKACKYLPTDLANLEFYLSECGNPDKQTCPLTDKQIDRQTDMKRIQALSCPLHLSLHIVLTIYNSTTHAVTNPVSRFRYTMIISND